MSDRVKDILGWIVSIIVALALFLMLRYYVVTATLVKQYSMSPTLESNDRLFLNRWGRTTKAKPERGDIITFEAPSKKSFDYEEADIQNPVAVYDKEFKNWAQEFAYYVLEISKDSYIKRVIALEGEHVTISEDGMVYINGEKLEESYLPEGLKTERTGPFYDFVVPEGYIFAMGDNRGRSADCREFGCIPMNKIEGTVICRFWPLNKIGKVE